MKKLFVFINLIFPLALSSCGANANNPHIAKNGELDYVSEINYDNAFINATFDYMDKMIKANETFVFYLTSYECSHCEEFKDKIVSYVKNSHQLIAKMEIVDYNESGIAKYSDDFQKFVNVYSDYFFINKEILTPQIYIVSGANVAKKVSNSRYTTLTMLTNAMNEYVYSSNVYSFSTLNSYNAFLNNNPNIITTIIDRKKINASNLYYYGIDEKIKYSSKITALIEIDEENEIDFASHFEIEDFDYPYLIYNENTIKDKIKVTSVNEATSFLDKYL